MGSVHALSGTPDNRAVSSMFLTEAEIDALCEPTKQPAAQFRKLKGMGLKAWMSAGRRKRVQVARGAYEAWKNPPPPPAAPTPHWTELLPAPPPWHETPLGRWQQEQREAKAEEDARRAAEPQPTKEEQAELARAAAARAAEQHAAVVRFHASKRRVLRVASIIQVGDRWRAQRSSRGQGSRQGCGTGARQRQREGFAPGQGPSGPQRREPVCQVPALHDSTGHRQRHLFRPDG